MRSVTSLWLLLLIGCSTAAPAPHTHYLMRADAPDRSESVGSLPRVGIRRVTVAPYLDKPGLVLETAPGQVRSARYHEWAEPLPEGLRSLLRGELSRLLGSDVDDAESRATSWGVAIDVAVEQFHGTAAGDALLEASWQIDRVAEKGDAARYRFTRRQPLARPGYEALAEAQVELARQLASAIAASIDGARSAGR
jgi:uncharacterized lipoprotein YmbA